MLRQRTKTLFLAAAVALTMGGSAIAQTTAPGTTAAPGAGAAPRTEDRGFNWGWLGLIGLAGLAGLSGRNRSTSTSTLNR